MKTDDRQLNIRHFKDSDANAVRDLFIRVNRLLAPADLIAEFDSYIERSLQEEMLHISEYYAQRQGRFYVAMLCQTLQGMFGLEASRAGAMELRRMYVDPDVRGRGIGRKLLQHAEEETVLAGCTRLVLSTSEIQQAALALYRSSGYKLIREEIAHTETTKTLGGGLRRFYFEKQL